MITTGDQLIAAVNNCQLLEGECAFWWLGQHGVILKLGSVVCYIDAFLSPIEGRQVPPLLRPEQVTNATLFLGSHDHADHIDRAAWPGLATASPSALFIVPELKRQQLADEVGLAEARLRGVDHGLAVEIAGVKITGVPAAHEFLDRDELTGLHPYVGFVLEGNGCTIYHAGDTCIYEGMQTLLRQWRFDLAFLPINGRDARRLASGCIGNMTYQEAVDLAGTMRPGLSVPTHFEMFATNSENPQLFVDYMKVKYPGLATHIPQHGECVRVANGAVI
ncbi:MAG: MBL fold metallo-hydrolase [Abitibacteriaceae bacterium]|nr:MBL fold metallo-hydrolase [Abditibacteriaceae bacterium]MBV9863811.1 MBL fold metallo-hydrolase [Abditibacteriaceae bacterium]